MAEHQIKIPDKAALMAVITGRTMCKFIGKRSDEQRSALITYKEINY